MSNLPNLHPAMIHFPIALFAIVVLLDGLRIFFQKKWMENSSFFLAVLAFFGGIAAYLTGDHAADSFNLNPDQMAAVSKHAEIAEVAILAIGVYALFRLVAFIKIKKTGTVLRTITFALSLVPMILVALAADAGGALVYRHGLGVRVVKPKVEKSDASKLDSINTSTDEKKGTLNSPQQKINAPSFSSSFSEQGDWDWSARENKKDKFIYTFKLKGVPGLVIEESTDRENNPLRLKFQSSEPKFLLFPQLADQLEIEAVVDFSDFQGTFALVHHVSVDRKVFDGLRWMNGKLALIRYSEKGWKVYQEKPVNGIGKIRLKVAVYQKHFRAYLDGKLLFHSHAHPLKEGKLGIFAEGLGDAAIYSFKIEKK